MHILQLLNFKPDDADLSDILKNDMTFDTVK